MEKGKFVFICPHCKLELGKCICQRLFSNGAFYQTSPVQGYGTDD